MKLFSISVGRKTLRQYNMGPVMQLSEKRLLSICLSFTIYYIKYKRSLPHDSVNLTYCFVKLEKVYGALFSLHMGKHVGAQSYGL